MLLQAFAIYLVSDTFDLTLLNDISSQISYLQNCKIKAFFLTIFHILIFFFLRGAKRYLLRYVAGRAPVCPASVGSCVLTSQHSERDEKPEMSWCGQIKHTLYRPHARCIYLCVDAGRVDWLAARSTRNHITEYCTWALQWSDYFLFIIFWLLFFDYYFLIIIFW